MNKHETAAGMKHRPPEVSPAEAMKAGERAGKLEALRDVIRFAAGLQAAQGLLDDPRPLEQIRVYCADRIRAVTGG